MKRKFGQYITPEGTPSSPPRSTPPSSSPVKRQCHDGRARTAKPGHSPANLFGTVPKKPVIELPRPARTSAEVRMQLVGYQTFRRVQIPSNYTFIHLHHLALFLFGWSGVHAHRFAVQNNITMHPSKRGQIKSGNLFIDVSPPRPPPTKREKREAQRLARALAKSNMRENPSDDSDTDWEGPGAWRPLVLDQVSVRQRSEEALTIGEVFGAHVCRRGRAVIYEYDPTHDQAFKVHITLIDLVQHDEPDQLSSPPAWPALPPLPPSSPIRSIASSPYTPRGRISSNDDSSPVRPLTRSQSFSGVLGEDEDLPERPSLPADRTNLPWVVQGRGIVPPERELFVAADDTADDEDKLSSAKQPKAKKKPGLGLRAKTIEMDTELFNGEEGDVFVRWLGGDVIVERQGDVLLVRDKTKQTEVTRSKSAGWDSDEDDTEHSDLAQEAVSVELLPGDAYAIDDGTREHPVEVDDEEEVVEEPLDGEENAEEPDDEGPADEDADEADPGFWD